MSADHTTRDLTTRVLVVLAAAFALGAALKGHLHHVTPVKIGERLPALELEELDGSSAQLAPADGITIYNVFATWCVPCQRETPRFAQLAERLQARGVRVVGIDQGEPPERVRAFKQSFGLDYPVFIDDDHLTNALLGARVIPETVVTRNGVLSSVYVGPLDSQAFQALKGVHG